MDMFDDDFNLDSLSDLDCLRIIGVAIDKARDNDDAIDEAFSLDALGRNLNVGDE